VWIIEPSIDPLSPKNRTLRPAQVASVLARIGLIGAVAQGRDVAVLGGAGPVPPDVPLVVQVSRWDHLKDMDGVLRGFAEHVAGHAGARLALIGPDVSAVTDDPEGADALAECLRTWESLPTHAHNAVRLVALPMDDPVANALMVNAVQRHARVVVQKSLQEGFGLTVAEAMWKSRPVVASAVGGLTGQVPPGTGVLLEDPRDLQAFGRAVRGLLDHPAAAVTMGRRGRRHVRAHSLSDRHLLQWARLVEHVSADDGAG
jgi:trehalose synthase